jgi:selenocysteine-specific elongation factor
MPHIIVGTAGHIDHGKTALVQLLTGIDADRLKEEQERGITIDIGFANLDLDETTQVGFVDVPGHEKFIKNMLAGIGGIDVVMLVVAADESIMPQTLEHMDICSLLHVPHGLTVITKIDAVDKEMADLVELEVRDYLEPTFLGGAPVVRVSARTGEGKTELIETLRQVAIKVEAKDTSQLFRLPVDRCFTMKGFGTVVTGTLISGSVRKEDEVQLLPSGGIARIRGLQVHGEAVGAAEAGQRTAINLQGVDVRDVNRGMVLTEPGTLRAASMFDCHLDLLPSAAGPISRRRRIRFHVGTAEIMGYVSLLEGDRLEPGGSSLVQIRLEEPVAAFPGDRFIVRQYSPMITIGGGEILEADPKKHRLRDSRITARLETLKDGSLEDRLMVLVDEAGLGTSTLPDLVGKLGIAATTVRHHLDRLEAAGAVRFLSNTPATVVSGSGFEEAASRVIDYVADFHKSEPLSRGVSREQLRNSLFRRSSNLVFQAVLEDLERREKITLAQELVHAFGRAVTLEAEEIQIREALAQEFRQNGFQVATAEEIIGKLRLDRQKARKIVRLMIEDGTLAKVSDEMVVDRSVIDEVVEKLRALKATHPDLGVGEFKDLAGVSRKYAIPLLEYLDRERVTRRVGNSRKIL